MPNTRPPRRPPPRVLLLALALLAGSNLQMACVSTPQVPRENVQTAEEDFIARAVREVLAEQGFDLAHDSGRLFESAWTGDDALRQRVRVQITDSAMGFALSGRVTFVVPLDPATAVDPTDPSIVVIDGALWRVDEARREFAKVEESRILNAIQERWRVLRARHAPQIARL